MLPTDDRYRNLNMIQKLVLLSAMERDKTANFAQDKTLFEDLKLYSNPVLYAREQELRNDPLSQSEGDYEGGKTNKINAEFIQHSKTAAKTGKPMLSDSMQKAIADFYAIQTDKKTKYVKLSDDDDEVVG